MDGCRAVCSTTGRATGDAPARIGALGPDAVSWLRTRPHSALVVHADGTTTVLDASTVR